MDQIQFYLREVSQLASAMPVAAIRRVVDRLLTAYEEERRLILLGNGGSAATASHLVADFQKMIYLEGGKPFRAMACTSLALAFRTSVSIQSPTSAIAPLLVPIHSR